MARKRVGREIVEGLQAFDEALRKPTKAVTDEDTGRRVTPVTGRPASQRVEAPPCPSCRSPNTHVYATRRPVRYCKCRRCGHTYTVAITRPQPGGQS